MYKIKLSNFEGPFDLLLYFIKRDELNIYDIPIARITEEFLNYVRLMQFLDLELAGEFILMASTLMYIKTQMLLPKKVSDDSGDIEDPRSQLVQSLLEYKQFKDASRYLHDNAESNRYVFYRQLFDTDLEMNEQENIYSNANVFDLIAAYNKIINKIQPANNLHLVKILPVSVEEMVQSILLKLQKKKRLSFFELIMNDDIIPFRQKTVATFLAILELIKSQKIYVIQDEIYDDIIIALRPLLN